MITRKTIKKQARWRPIWEIADPADDDFSLAGAVADYILQERVGYKYHCSIFFDVRKRTARAQCPVRYDWTRKNLIGIATADRDVAHGWIVDALLLGFAVFASALADSCAGSQGTLEEIRARLRERNHISRNSNHELA